MLSHQGVALFEMIRRIRRYGLVGIDLALFKEVCHFRVSIEVSKGHARPSLCLSLSLPADPDVKLSITYLVLTNVQSCSMP